MMGGGPRIAADATRRHGIALASLAVTGAPVAAAAGRCRPPEQPRDLRAAVDRRRASSRSAWAWGGARTGMTSFLIDGRTFDPEPHRPAVAAADGRGVDHRQRQPDGPPVPPARLADAARRRDGGRPLDELAWQDVVDVPARGEVTVRVAFDDFAGRTVYHCHILDHEDLGMMGVIEVR